MIRRIREICRHEMFFPGWIGIFVNPFYIARAGLCGAMQELAPKLTDRLLDVGCGSKPYQSLFHVASYVGLDIDCEGTRKLGIADQFYDGKTFPFADSSFDSVLCNQVLEHVFNPEDFVSEIARVLKPGGRLLLTVPFVWDEHEQPFDYARYSSFGLRALLDKHGFTVVRHNKLGADASILFQLANVYLFKITQSFPRPFKLLLTMSVMAFINVLGLLAMRLSPNNPDFFLDHVILVEKRS